MHGATNTACASLMLATSLQGYCDGICNKNAVAKSISDSKNDNKAGDNIAEASKAHMIGSTIKVIQEPNNTHPPRDSEGHKICSASYQRNSQLTP